MKTNDESKTQDNADTAHSHDKEVIDVRTALKELEQQHQAAKQVESSFMEVLHSFFLEGQEVAEDVAERSANIGCAALVGSQISTKSEELFTWLATQAETMADAKPIMNSYAALCALGASVAERASQEWKQLADTVGEFETEVLEVEETAKAGAKATESATPNAPIIAKENEVPPVKLTKLERRAARRAANKMQA